MLSQKAYQELCNLLVKKDQACIHIIYKHYGDALYGIILKILGNEEDAAEVLQDVFVKIWENGHHYNPKYGRLFTWMATISRNLAINKRNSKQNRQQSKIQSDQNLVYNDKLKKESTNPDVLDIKGMLGQIDNKYKTVISLIYFYGYTQQEVSDKLNIPLGTVKSRVKIGLRELRKLYDFGLTSSLLIAISQAGSIV